MTKVVLDISMSVDGFIAGPNDSPDNPMGDNGMQLHAWLWGNKEAGIPGEGAVGKDRELIDELKKTTGSFIAGRRTYNIVHGWGGKHPLGAIPGFVLSADTPADVPEGETKFTFLDNVHSIVKQAKIAAGDKNVYVLGGASVAQQCLRAGLVDEIQLHIAPVLLCRGVRLFVDLSDLPINLEKIAVIDTPAATHVRYRVTRQASALA